MSKFCTQCGNKLPDDAMFCGQCGARLNVEPTTKSEEPKVEPSQKENPTNDTPYNAPIHNKSTQTKTTTKKKTIIGACCAGVALLLVLVIVLATSGWGGKAPGGTTGNKGDDVVPVIGGNETAVSLTLSEYVSEYNSALRRTVSSSVNTNVSDSDYIGCAKTLINKALKNPSTAQYNSASVYEKDSYGRAIVYLDVSAQNSFGGWVRSEYYVCIQSYASDGTFTYSKTVPYTDDKSNYNILLLMNDFGEDPADEELEGMLFEYADFVSEGPSFAVSPSQSLNCYKLVFDYGIQFVYVDTTTNKVVSVQTAFTNTSGHTSDCEKICAASIAALTDTSMSTAKENIANVMSFSSFSPTSTPAFYNDGFVYDCAYGFSGVDMAVTIASEDSYKSGLYWSPNNEEAYYENLADEYAENKDFDNAIIYYEQAQIGGDKLNAAYYGKAEQSFADGDLDTAGLYFGYAGNYKDAAVRVLEVFYSAGQKHEKNKDYNSAIYSYSMAGDYSDAKAKYRECNFKQGELDLSNKQYLEAATCFEAAADYSGANEKHKESCYLYAEQQLLIGSTDTAATYFKKAGDYKDAATRMQKYYYDKGTEHLASKEYLEAADAFKQIMDYSDASDKYKEANYLYGEKMLEQGNVESAKTYFYNASGYSDADTRVQRYYYEAGETLLKSGEYLSAVDKYSLAGNYSDAPTKILECYYQYGNKELSLNYITEATTYLSKCRGYKDTDDILLGYYYGEATKAVKVLMDAFPAKTFTATVDNAYKDAKNKLVLCEGYKDSSTLLTIVEKLYYVWTEMQFESNWEASLYEMTASYSGDVISITKSNFMSGTSCTLSMTHNVKNNTFSADITHMFNLSAREYDVRKVVSAMLVLFTDIENTTDFDTKFSNKSNWTISGDNESFTMSYGGYNISVQTKPEAYGYIDCSITVTK